VIWLVARLDPRVIWLVPDLLNLAFTHPSTVNDITSYVWLGGARLTEHSLLAMLR
jgi:hypothetical protein